MSDLTDRDLIERALTGDGDAFGVLVQRYQTSVYNVCYRFLGERRDAEDQTQEAFIRAYERLHTFNLTRDFGPWIRRVAANLCINRLQRKRLLNVPLDPERDALPRNPSSDPALALEASERSDALRQAIISLPPHYRAVIELRHLQNLPYAEIARALNLPLSDVKSHLFRARKRLAEIMRSFDEPHTR